MTQIRLQPAQPIERVMPMRTLHLPQSKLSVAENVLRSTAPVPAHAAAMTPPMQTAGNIAFAGKNRLRDLAPGIVQLITLQKRPLQSIAQDRAQLREWRNAPAPMNLSFADQVTRALSQSAHHNQYSPSTAEVHRLLTSAPDGSVGPNTQMLRAFHAEYTTAFTHLRSRLHESPVTEKRGAPYEATRWSWWEHEGQQVREHKLDGTLTRFTLGLVPELVPDIAGSIATAAQQRGLAYYMRIPQAHDMPRFVAQHTAIAEQLVFIVPTTQADRAASLLMDTRDAYEEYFGIFASPSPFSSEVRGRDGETNTGIHVSDFPWVRGTSHHQLWSAMLSTSMHEAQLGELRGERWRTAVDMRMRNWAVSFGYSPHNMARRAALDTGHRAILAGLSLALDTRKLDQPDTLSHTFHTTLRNNGINSHEEFLHSMHIDWQQLRWTRS